MAKILEILADKQDVQEKLRAEIAEARNGQDIGYDQLIELPYLDAVCRETLRLSAFAITLSMCVLTPHPADTHQRRPRGESEYPLISVLSLLLNTATSVPPVT